MTKNDFHLASTQFRVLEPMDYQTGQLQTGTSKEKILFCGTLSESHTYLDLKIFPSCKYQLSRCYFVFERWLLSSIVSNVVVLLMVCSGPARSLGKFSHRSATSDHKEALTRCLFRSLQLHTQARWVL
jgi:hypothetical protein